MPRSASASTSAGAAPARDAAVLVSDIHLDAAAPRTAQAFFDFLAAHVPHARQLFILGDLFEAWPGDDALALPFNAEVVARLRAVSDAGVALSWMAGNRDFLIGPGFAAAAGLTILPDPSVVSIGGHAFTLAHGDAECTDDAPYQAFRSQVRTAAWATDFQSRPLAERLQLIAGMREGSRAAQRDKSVQIMDVNAGAIDRLFETTGTTRMIHGHTHRPAMHRLTADNGSERIRHVLPDWDCEGDVRRGGGLAIDADGVVRVLTL